MSTTLLSQGKTLKYDGVESMVREEEHLFEVGQIAFTLLFLFFHFPFSVILSFVDTLHEIFQSDYRLRCWFGKFNGVNADVLELYMGKFGYLWIWWNINNNWLRHGEKWSCG